MTKIKRETSFSSSGADFFTRIYQTKPMEEKCEVVVLVHGLGICGTYMHHLAKELSHKYLVYVPDLPGFGYSSKPQYTLTMQEMADALNDWAEAADLPKAYYLGNSSGCQVITDLFVHHPEKVKGVILQGPGVDPTGRNKATQLKWFLKNSPYEPASQTLIMIKDYRLAGIRRVLKTFDYALRYKIEEYLPKITVPALVVRGGKDKLVTHTWAKKATELLPQGRLKTIPEAAHTINYSHPHHLAQVTGEFIETIEAQIYESTH